jgi:hypothetical protein
VDFSRSLSVGLVPERHVAGWIGQRKTVTDEVSDYLLPIADREPLRWIVREQRTALPEHRAREANAVRPGDRIFLYATRGCFHNPTRDRGRVIGQAVVTKPSRRLSQPVRFGGRDYPLDLSMKIERLAPIREGVELAPLVNSMATFPDSGSWSVVLRRALVTLADGDGELLAAKLARVAPRYPKARATYAE